VYLSNNIYYNSKKYPLNRKGWRNIKKKKKKKFFLKKKTLNIIFNLKIIILIFLKIKKENIKKKKKIEKKRKIE